ncbi:MAG: hypothetical protein ACYDHP_08455, partial [Ferrimicrobium sp.]
IHQPKTSPTPLPAPLHIGTTTYPLNISEIRQIGGHLPESWANIGGREAEQHPWPEAYHAPGQMPSDATTST